MSSCPTCSTLGVPLLFGLPVEAGKAAGAAGDLVLMGCVEPENAPHYVCANEHTWRGEDEHEWQADLLAALKMHGYVEPPVYGD